MRDGNPVRVVPSTLETKDGEVRNVPGNAFDKHGSNNPIVTTLMARFHAGVIGAVTQLDPTSVLDIGCGEGRTTRLVYEALPRLVVGMDLEEVVLKEARVNVPGGEFFVGSAYQIPHADNQFDVVLGTEVLEHVDDPNRAIDEMLRVASQGIVVTVPHEPWWRIANLARGRYVRQLGNTPGHIQHWSAPRFRSLLRSHVDRAEVTPVGLWLLGIVEL